MQCRRHIPGFAFSLVFVLSYFTNKFVLSVLKFTYPTLFQGWQTFIGAVLLLLSGKLGWVEMSFITRSSAVSWLPASLLFVGNIYAGSRALSRLDIPFFFTLQNSSHVVTYFITTALHREKHKTHQLKTISMGLMLLSAVNLPLWDPQVDRSAYLWAVCHLLCAGAYKAFEFHKSSNLSDCEQYCINCLFSVLVLALAAHPTGDLTGALEFPSLYSGVFHCGCGARWRLSASASRLSYEPPPRVQRPAVWRRKKSLCELRIFKVPKYLRGDASYWALLGRVWLSGRLLQDWNSP
uniref:Transmembrane protein 241 n=1 Tax=Oryzias latipes TaxID=8090 RepID=A0A3B3HLA0_ORYLA